MNTLVEDELEMSSDEAVISALTPKRLNKLELEPFSVLRQAIAMDLCGRGKGHFFNAVMTVWVCTLKPLEALEAHDDMVQARLKAFQWATERGYSLNACEELFEAYRRLDAELKPTSNVQVRAAQHDGQSSKNAGGQPT